MFCKTGKDVVAVIAAAVVSSDGVDMVSTGLIDFCFVCLGVVPARLRLWLISCMRRCWLCEVHDRIVEQSLV